MIRYMIAVLSALMLLGTVPNSAAAATSEDLAQKTLRITKYAKGVNKACPKGSDKMFIVRVHVRHSSLGLLVDGDHGVGEIVLRSDRQLNAEDYVVPPLETTAEFYFFAPSRKSRVKKDPTENSVTVELSGPNMKLRVSKLRSDCLESYGG